MHRMLCVFTLFAILIAPAAEAGWENAEWGMTPEEVVAVLDDAVLVARDGFVYLEVGQVLTEVHPNRAISLEALLLFRSNKLSYVLLSVTGPELKDDCKVLEQWMHEQLGASAAPEEREGVLITHRHPKNRSVVWEDIAHGNRVSFSWIWTQQSSGSSLYACGPSYEALEPDW